MSSWKPRLVARRGRGGAARVPTSTAGHLGTVLMSAVYFVGWLFLSPEWPLALRVVFAFGIGAWGLVALRDFAAWLLADEAERARFLEAAARADAEQRARFRNAAVFTVRPWHRAVAAIALLAALGGFASTRSSELLVATLLIAVINALLWRR